MKLLCIPLANIFYFPVWWYSLGLKKKIVNFGANIKKTAHNLSLKIMFTYLFKPMFGDVSRSGRIISFFMRLVLLIYKLFLFIINLIWQIFLLILWVGLLPVTIYFIVQIL